MRVLTTDPQKIAEDTEEFHRRLDRAADLASELSRAIHNARMLAPTVLELGLLRASMERATNITADLQVVAKGSELTA